MGADLLVLQWDQRIVAADRTGIFQPGRVQSAGDFYYRRGVYGDIFFVYKIIFPEERA